MFLIVLFKKEKNRAFTLGFTAKRKNRFFCRPFRFVFAFRSLAKNAKTFAFFSKFRFNLFREKMRKFREKMRIVFASFIFAKKFAKRERKFFHLFAFFRETFRSLETLVLSIPI